MAFIKCGIRPREFCDMDRFEKAAVIGFLQQYGKDSKKEADEIKNSGKKKR